MTASNTIHDEAPAATHRHRVEVETDVAVLELRIVKPMSIIRAVRCILNREHLDYAVTVNVMVTGDRQLQDLNRKFAKEDHVTDVLAFPANDGPTLPGDSALADEESGPRPLGDIAISLPQVLRQARENGVPFQRELSMLAIHGTLHLLGYDHATPDEERIMFGKTDDALAQLFDDDAQHID